MILLKLTFCTQISLNIRHTLSSRQHLFFFHGTTRNSYIYTSKCPNVAVESWMNRNEIRSALLSGIPRTFSQFSDNGVPLFQDSIQWRSCGNSRHFCVVPLFNKQFPGLVPIQDNNYWPSCSQSKVSLHGQLLYLPGHQMSSPLEGPHCLYHCLFIQKFTTLVLWIPTLFLLIISQNLVMSHIICRCLALAPFSAAYCLQGLCAGEAVPWGTSPTCLQELCFSTRLTSVDPLFGWRTKLSFCYSTATFILCGWIHNLKSLVM